jgi:hypothetical protein
MIRKKKFSFVVLTMQHFLKNLGSKFEFIFFILYGRELGGAGFSLYLNKRREALG